MVDERFTTATNRRGLIGRRRCKVKYKWGNGDITGNIKMVRKKVNNDKKEERRKGQKDIKKSKRINKQNRKRSEKKR